MSIESIEQMTLNELNVLVLINRLIDTSFIPSKEKIYTLNNDYSLSFYDRIIMHKTLTKPTLDEFNSELEIYKNELKEIELARLAELERIADLERRFLNLEHIRQAISNCGTDQPNHLIELKRIIAENDTIKLEQYEQENSTLVEKYSKENALKDKIKLGAMARKICIEVLDYIAGLNLIKSLTKEQIDQMEVIFSDIHTALKNNRPDTARTLIENITPDGVLLTNEEKDSILYIYELNGL